MLEDKLVSVAQKAIASFLPKRLQVERGAALLYQIAVDNNLSIAINPRFPTRGQSAFQTDLCIFETRSVKIRIPRVVIEFKPGLSTHDVLTYSTKARKHKQIYPYLRYGLVTARPIAVPGRFFTHNEALDFCLATGGLSTSAIGAWLRALIRKEVAASRRLEAIAFDKTSARLFRNEIKLGP